MHLQSLEIIGFKSFRDKTVIKFDKGITALVGRNGHGKSNLVDAIRWALSAGVRQTKDLRVKKSADVIFSGTYDDNGNTLSPASHFAEVAITFSNEDKAIDIPSPSVEFRRIMDESGNSEYFINRNKVRADEIRTLLYNTGIGKTGYSVLEQGKIGKILSDKPEERRTVFEEAASISYYKKQMSDASKDLQSTEENLKQIEVDYNRLKRENDKLKKQKDNLVLYKKLKETLLNSSIKSRLLYLAESEKQKSEFEQKISKNNTIIEKLKLKTAEKRKQYEDMSLAMKDVLKQKTEIANKLQTLYQEKADLTNKYDVSIVHLENEKARFAELDSKNNDLRENEKRLSLLIKEEEKVIKIFATEKEKATLEIDNLTKKLEKINADIKKNDEDAKKKDEYLLNLRTEISDKIADCFTKLFSFLDEVKKGDLKSLDSAIKELETLKELFEDYKKAQPQFVDKLFVENKKNLEKEHSALLTEISEKNSILSEKSLKFMRAEDSLNLKKNELAEVKSELDKRNSALSTNKKAIDDLTEVLKKTKSQLDEKEKELITQQKIQTQVDKTVEKLSNIDISSIAEDEKKMNEMSLEIAGYNAKIELLNESINNLQTEFFDDYGRTTQDMKNSINITENDSKENLRKIIQETNQKIKECGTINEFAEDQFNDNDEQYKLVKTQYEDLIKAKEDIKKAEVELKDRSREQFLETFEKIKVAFDDTFKIMFGGGNAVLELKKEEGVEFDPLTCGIDIKVQPPGKAMRLLGLSGGEASKVAAVLLFAIYRVKTTPFCILDEIDAAWDSHNISAFLEMLHHFSEDIQFLIVTHQTQTAKGVDRLLGITQEEEGVSKTFDYSINKKAVDNIISKMRS